MRGMLPSLCFFGRRVRSGSVRLLSWHGNTVGMVTSVSGMLTKPGLALWSTDPGDGFRAVDVTDEALTATDTRPLDAGAVGDGHIVARFHGDIAGDYKVGRRTVAVDPDAERAARSVDLDLVGTPTALPRPGVLT